MIKYINDGNLFESAADALVNTVNTQGVMGKGIALQFKGYFKKNFTVYKDYCKSGKLNVGSLLFVEDSSLLYGKKLIINFPTKTEWRKPSEYSYLESGLAELKKEIISRNISSIALPLLGAGNGGLEVAKVIKLIDRYLQNIPNCTIEVYLPNTIYRLKRNKKDVALTPARASLLAVLYDMVDYGYDTTNFATQKIIYLLQEFGAREYFKLDFKSGKYGPYADTIRHILFGLQDAYIFGNIDKNLKPFEPFGLMLDRKEEVLNYLSQPDNNHISSIVDMVKKFLQENKFYSDYYLELITSVGYIIKNNTNCDLESIKVELINWGDASGNLNKEVFANDKFLPQIIDLITQNIRHNSN
ncbi:MAG: macro domain-containing protein [Methylacidiphilales bacterium]|nr:macro domain-containing protein [Candidatus Methylacidiphilales bacterium]